MKMIRKLGFMVILAALILSMAVPAFAANTADINIIDFSVPRQYLSVVPYARKDNNTSLYVYLTNIMNGNVGIFCAAYGYDAEGDYKGNFTISNTTNYVSEVLIFEGSKFRVQNGIYERLHGQGTCYAAPAFRCSSYLNMDEKIYKGKWSPDCAGQYTYATA